MVDLTRYNQTQLLRYYSELSDSEKKLLDSQLNIIDFDFMNNIYKNSYIDEEIDLKKISPLKIIDDLYNTQYFETGKKLVQNGEYALLLLAGGLGSRLGFNRSKGCLKLNINGKKISLFELYINELKKANKECNTLIKLYIMASDYNYKDIINFFEENNYFNYPRKSIKIFVQGKLPILDINGKLLLKNKNEILFGPNGNGDVFESLKNNNLINDMKENNIKYVLFSIIDNPLNNLVDYNFIGATIENNYSLSSKTITKESNEDKDYVFCKYDNKPFMLPSQYISQDISDYKIDDKYVYREKNIANHLISIEEIEKFSNVELKYHRAYKKNSYINDDNILVNPNNPNTFKFEKYIFDAFNYADDMLLYRVKKDKYMPIKIREDIIKIENYFNK